MQQPALGTEDMWMSLKFSRRYSDIPASARSNRTTEGATRHWLMLHTFYKWGKQSDIGCLPPSRGQVEPDLVQLLPQRSAPVFRLGPAGQERCESGAGKHSGARWQIHSKSDVKKNPSFTDFKLGLTEQMCLCWYDYGVRLLITHHTNTFKTNICDPSQ